MATGFEVRVPFCDYRLVEYVWNIPWEMKNTGNIEKGILREAFKGILPDDARTRKKSAYPSTQNPSYLDALRQWTLHILDNKNEPIHNFIKPEVMRAIAEQKIALPGEAGAPTSRGATLSAGASPSISFEPIARLVGSFRKRSVSK